jgi:hypothetical protein
MLGPLDDLVINGPVTLPNVPPSIDWLAIRLPATGTTPNCLIISLRFMLMFLSISLF